MKRYIDADAFDERVRVAGGFAEEELTDDFKDGVLTVLEMLKTQPTADVRENVRGEWVLMSCADGYFCACKYCGAWSPTRKQLKYCPNCGESKKINEKWINLDYGNNAVNPYP